MYKKKPFNDKTKSCVKRILEKIAPEEILIFDGMWLEMQEYENIPIDEAEIVDTKFGMGGKHASFTYYTPILINIITKLEGGYIENSEKKIFDFIFEQYQLNKINFEDEKEIKNLASLIWKEFHSLKR